MKQTVKCIVPNVIGITEAAAITAIEAAGMAARVMGRDRELLLGTCDMREDRVNIIVMSGLVTRTYIG